MNKKKKKYLNNHDTNILLDFYVSEVNVYCVIATDWDNNNINQELERSKCIWLCLFVYWFFGGFFRGLFFIFVLFCLFGVFIHNHKIGE